MYADGYVPKNQRRFDQMVQFFSFCHSVKSLDGLMMGLFLPDKDYAREDILVARERRAEELSK